jgi:hypothetical protein
MIMRTPHTNLAPRGRWRLTSLLALAAGCAAQQHPAGAPSGPAADGPRTPEAILSDAVQATGGAAWSAHKTARVKMTIVFQGMAMGGPAEHFQTSGDKALTVTTLPGVGQVSEGTNGTVFWSKDPVNGLRYLEGAEAEQARIEASWNADLQAAALFSKIELSPDSPAGLECLTLTPKSGAPLRNCYDRQTHLQVSQEGTRATPQGDVPFRTKESDWRIVGGVKMAYASESQAGPITILTTIDQVVFDEPLDDKMFDPPAPTAN